MKLDVWKFVRKEDGTFAILHKGQILKTSIPEQWLESELAKHGFCGQEYHDIRRQLELHGRAEVTL